jgi:ABC-2 type transport system permease protein
MSLYRAESRRLVKRRLIRYLAITGLIVLAAVAVGTFFTNHKVGAAERAVAVQKADQDFADQVKQTADMKAACEKAAGTPEAKNFPSNCADITAPQRDQIQAEWYLPSTFEFRKQFEGTVITFAAVLALVAFVAGASFVGAEWSTGGMMNLLLWRPQRLKVLGTKLAALVVWSTGLTVVAGALWTAAFWAIGSLRGSTEKMTPGVWQSLGLTGLRGLALILAAAIIGFALASLGRHTAMALGVAIGFGVVVQFGLGIVLNLAHVKFYEAWLLPVWGMAWMQKSVTLQDYDACNFNAYGECKPPEMTIDWQTTGSGLLLAVVIIVAVAMWTMRSRDVT